MSEETTTGATADTTTDTTTETEMVMMTAVNGDILVMTSAGDTAAAKWVFKVGGLMRMPMHDSMRHPRGLLECMPYLMSRLRCHYGGSSVSSVSVYAGHARNRLSISVIYFLRYGWTYGWM